MQKYVTPVAAAAAVAALALGGHVIFGGGGTSSDLAAPADVTTPVASVADPSPAEAVPVDLSIPMDPANVAPGPKYPVNVAGQTYGGIPTAPDGSDLPYAQWPDLVAVMLSDTSKFPGVAGFAYKADLHMDPDNPADNPSTPEEMLAYQAKEPGMMLTLYAADGATVLARQHLWDDTTDGMGDPDE